MKIPVNDPGRCNRAIASEILQAVKSVVDSGCYVLGEQVAEFERAFGEFCGVDHCVAVANGTDALELALRAVDIGPGDQVATVANAGPYSSVAIRRVGATPLYVDIDLRTLLMDPQALSQTMGPQIRAVIVTHLYGCLAQMERLCDIARRHGARVIEDCAQAHGASRAGKRAGSWGDCGCFSFYPTKNLGALGDAGAVVTNDRDIASQVQSLREYGWDREAKYHQVLPGGTNSRMDECQAAVLNIKLIHLQTWNAERQVAAEQYNQRLGGLDLQLPACGRGDVVHLYVLRTKWRNELQAALQAQGIATAIHYPRPDYRETAENTEPAVTRLPKTEQACNEVLTLPLFPGIRGQEIAAVADAVADTLNRIARQAG